MLHAARVKRLEVMYKQQRHLNDEDQGRDGVKDEGAVPYVKMSNLPPPQDDTLA